MDKQRTIEVLTELLEHKRMNARQLSTALGYRSPNWLYETLSPDRGAGLSKQRAERIVEIFPDVSLSYLLTGEGNLIKTDTSNNVQHNINSSNITQTGNVETANLDKLIAVIAEQSQHIDRLITLLEKKEQ